MKKGDSLSEYHKKRDFSRTSEPGGEPVERSGSDPIFVIQKHDASTLHYDVRLEVDGVLKSWAVPKGPSTDPSEKRLALPTEDHPIDYADFEGRIPEDSYGAGTVLIWDRGTYRNLRAEKEGDGTSIEKAVEEGKVEVWLEGEKLRGGYVLIRTDRGEGEQWLFIKMKDEEADARRKPTSTQGESVESGRSLKEIKEDADR